MGVARSGGGLQCVYVKGEVLLIDRNVCLGGEAWTLPCRDLGGGNCWNMVDYVVNKQ